MKKRLLSTALVLMVVFFFGVSGIGAELSAQEILARVGMGILTGEGQSSSTIKMTVKGPEQPEEVLRFKAYRRKVEGKPSKLLLLYLEPKCMSGTVFLAVGDRLWLYLSAFDSVKEFATQEQRSMSFAGSNMSYEEIAGGIGYYSKKYQAERTGKNTDEPVYRLKLTPKEGMELEWPLIKVWVQKENFMAIKAEYYREGRLARLYKGGDIYEESGNFIPHWLKMEEKPTGSKTEVVVLSYKKEPVPKEMFALGNLSDLSKEVKGG